MKIVMKHVKSMLLRSGSAKSYTNIKVDPGQRLDAVKEDLEGKGHRFVKLLGDPYVSKFKPLDLPEYRVPPPNAHEHNGSG